MGRVLVVLMSFLLSLSMAAGAQTTAPPSTSDTIPARVNLDPAPPVVPAASTPMHVVAPPVPNQTNVVVPDIRVSTPLVPSGPDPSVVRAAETATPGTVATGTVTAGAGVSYVSEAPPNGPVVSVADAATQYKMRKTGMKSRVIDNNTLSTLDANPGLITANELTMPQGDNVSPEEEAALRNKRPEFAAAGDTLDPRDLAAVEAAVRRSEMQRNDPTTAPRGAASEQYEQMTQEAEAATASEPLLQAQAHDPQAEVPDPAASATEPMPKPSPATANETQREQLPESSSALPLLGLLGFIAMAGGAVSLMRARA